MDSNKVPLPFPDPKGPNREKLFEIYRDYVKHEDDLIHNRLMWNLTIQGFLITAYGFSIQKVAEIQTKAAPGYGMKQLVFLLCVIPVLGCATSILVWMSIKAAQMAISQLYKKWSEEIAPYKRAKGGLAKLPDLIGGGVEEAHRMGFRAALLIPSFITAAWIVLLGYFLICFSTP